MPWYMVSWHVEEEDHLIEDKRNGKMQNRRNYKRHIPQVSLLLWLKMVAVCCFVWPLALRLWSRRQTKILVIAIVF